MIEILHPENEQVWLEARTKDITSTEISCLFGISPYSTPFELWHRKKSQQYVKIDQNERMLWGNRLQDAIAQGIAEENGWTIRRMSEYIRNSELRIGASFDFDILSITENIGNTSYPQIQPQGIGLLEIKNVDGLVFKNEWITKEDGSVEAPLHIEIQCQHQMLVSGRQFLYLGALVAGNRLVLIKRTPDLRVHEAIKQKVKEFWASIDNNQEPEPVFEQDAEFINSLFGTAEPNKILTTEDEDIRTLALKHDALGKQEAEIKKERESIKAQIFLKISDAEKVIGPDYSIDAGMTGPSPRNFIMPGFRRFRVYPKGKK